MLESGIEPLIVGRGSENDRHSVVNRFREFIRVRGDDRTGFQGFPLSGRPVFPQACKGERTFTLQPDPHGLLPPPFCLPLIEPRRNDQTASFLEGSPKRGLLCHGLCFGVDALGANLGVFGPRRNQPPAQHDQFSERGVGFNPYGSHGLRRRDVVAGLEQGRVGDGKLLGNHIGGGRLGEASAHVGYASKARLSVRRCQD